MAVPFRKVSNTRGRKRRTHYKISENGTTKCPKCGTEIRPHRVCMNCGTYKGKEVIKKEEENNFLFLFDKYKLYDIINLSFDSDNYIV